MLLHDTRSRVKTRADNRQGCQHQAGGDDSYKIRLRLCCVLCNVLHERSGGGRRRRWVAAAAAVAAVEGGGWRRRRPFTSGVPPTTERGVLIPRGAARADAEITEWDTVIGGGGCCVLLNEPADSD